MGKKRGGGRGGGVVMQKPRKDPSAQALKALQEVQQNPFGVGGEDMAELLKDIKIPSTVGADKSVQLPWPSHDRKLLHDCDTFYKIYPTYLDSSKTQKLGRKLSKDLCVDTPTIYQISECLQSMRLRHVIEPHKGYSRDVESRWYNLGRILVDKKQKGIIPLEDRMTFSNKMDIMKEICRRLPTSPSRIRRLAALEEEKKKQKQIAADAASSSTATDAASTTSATSSTTTSSALGASKKKKGKKGRK